MMILESNTFVKALNTSELERNILVSIEIKYSTSIRSAEDSPFEEKKTQT